MLPLKKYPLLQLLTQEETCKYGVATAQQYVVTKLYPDEQTEQDPT